MHPDKRMRRVLCVSLRYESRENVDEQMAERSVNLSNWFKDETENWGQNSSECRNEFTNANIYGIVKGIRCLPEFFNVAFKIPVPLIYLPIVPS